MKKLLIFILIASFLSQGIAVSSEELGVEQKESKEVENLSLSSPINRATTKERDLELKPMNRATTSLSSSLIKEGRFKYQKSWAVLIGIDNYLNPPFNQSPLTYAVKDALDMGKLLIKEFGFSYQEMFLLIDTPNVNRLLRIENRIIKKRDKKGSLVPGEYILIDDSSRQLSGLKGITVKEATKDNIIKTLSSIMGSSNENERVLVFFAGHGDTVIIKKTGGEMGYIIPEDASERSAGGYYSSAIAMSEIRRISLQLPAKHTLFLVDACYSGLSAVKSYGITEKNPVDYIDKVFKLPASHVITGGRRGEKVIESSEWGNSAFTYKIIEALEAGVADLNNDQFITSTELGTYIGPVVTNLTATKTRTPQTPDHARFFGDGEFIFALANQGTLTINTIPWGHVYIDGSDFSEYSPLILKRMKAGEHRIMVKKKGYKPYETIVNISENSHTNLSIMLEEKK